MDTITYRDSGVDIHEGYRAVDKIKGHAMKTFTESVMGGIGSFGSFFHLGKGYEDPVLVSGCDGVGTKLRIALDRKIYHTVGEDCVAMCVNDILCHGAKPIFFLDYIACGKLEAEIAGELVRGLSQGCLKSGCSLIGGETAEMPGFYDEGDYDIAGFALGVVEKDKIINGESIEEGDVLIGIESSGLHSNGFSLVRKVFTDMDEEIDGEKVGDILLTPTRIYVKEIMDLLEKFNIKGMAHITGGGFIENIPRMFKDGIGACISKDSYSIPEIFKVLMERGVSEDEMYRTFNMGIGFVLCVTERDSEDIIDELQAKGLKSYRIGETVKGEGVCLK